MDRIEPSLTPADQSVRTPTRFGGAGAAGGPPWAVIAGAAVLLVGAAAVAYWYLQRGAEPPPPPPAPRAEAPAPAPASPPPIEHPLPAAPGAPPLPLLGHSDPLLTDTLNALLGAPAVQKLLVTPGFARRFVAFVDNIPREKLPRQEAPLRPAPGTLRVSGADDTLAIDPANAARYAPYVALAESVDIAKLVEAYVRLYPLFQQAYEELGYPQRYFNDRVVQAIDHLLQTPEIKGPLRLLQPKVRYEFADTQLEALSAAQKSLLRMGPDNAARLKARLRLLRTEIARSSAAR